MCVYTFYGIAVLLRCVLWWFTFHLDQWESERKKSATHTQCVLLKQKSSTKVHCALHTQHTLSICWLKIPSNRNGRLWWNCTNKQTKRINFALINRARIFFFLVGWLSIAGCCQRSRVTVVRRTMSTISHSPLCAILVSSIFSLSRLHISHF